MVSKELREMYNDQLHKERISTGRIASITTLIIAPLFHLKDVYMTEYINSTFLWRYLPFVVALIFLVVTFTSLKEYSKVVLISYLSLIYSVLVMMLGVFYANYQTVDGKFNSFLIAGMITTILMIQIFSSPVRRYMWTVSVIVLSFFLMTFITKGGDAFIISNMINPFATVTLFTIFSILNERKNFGEFRAKFMLELNERDLKNEVAYRRSLEKELTEEVLHDSLTGIYNKRASESILETRINYLIDNKRDFSLVFIDLDDLKTINDTRGHDEGDKYLITFANIVKGFLEKYEHVFRIGGDEFLIFFEDKNSDEVQYLVEVIAGKCLAEEIRFSFGIAYSDGYGYTNVEHFIKEADIKMYNQKRNKKKML